MGRTGNLVNFPIFIVNCLLSIRQRIPTLRDCCDRYAYHREFTGLCHRNYIAKAPRDADFPFRESTPRDPAA